MLQLNAVQLAEAIDAMNRINKPLMVWGSPGLGKSELFREAAQRHAAKVVDIRLTMWESVDLRGIPVNVDGYTVWVPPYCLPIEGNPNFDPDPNKPIFLVLDEVTQANPSVQSVAFQMVLERRVGEHKFMPNVRVMLASNKASDRAGGYRMLPPLANRMTHVELAPHLESWIKWAVQNNGSPMVMAFLRLRPELLSTFDPVKNELLFASPRSWSTVNEILTQKLSPQMRYTLIAGTVGDGVATEFEAFLRTWESLPDIDDIIARPKAADVPAKPDVMFALCAALAYRASTKNVDAIYTYAERLPEEYTMLIIRDTIRRVPAIQTTKAFNKIAVNYAHIFHED